MASGDGHDHQNSNSAKDTAFPELPGEQPLAHAGQQYREQAEATLATLGLLAVANGQPHSGTRAIVDIDLDDVPPLPADHRDFERRMETRTKIRAQNKANAERRLTIQMDAWTKVYGLLKRSTERLAPVLSRQMKNLCDMERTRNMPGGYFDGPRAWAMVLSAIEEGAKSEGDKDFYRTAERTQRASTLPDGCSAADYAKKALAFLVHIKPFLAQSYDDDDTAQYLISLMPKALRGDGRRIRTELKAEGR
jgi:hypothetical protein